MDAQTAATLGNRHERAQEVGQFLGERRELVDHHHETWQRIIDHPAIAREIVDSGRSQQALTAPHFGIEADEYPFGQAVVEVGHHPNGVRQPGTGIERRAALEVDQDHREMVGAGPRGERHHQRAQELALAGSRRAGDQTVGPIAHQVDVDDAVAGQPEPSDRCRVTPGLHPAASDHRRGVVSRWFEIGQGHVRRHAACAVVVLGVDQRRQPSCCGLRGRRRQPGDDDPAVDRRPGRSVGLDPPRRAGVAQLEDPIDDRRHRCVGCNDRQAGDVTAFQAPADRPGSGAEERRDVEHDHRSSPSIDTSIDTSEGSLHRVDQRGAVGCVDHARPTTGVR